MLLNIDPKKLAININTPIDSAIWKSTNWLHSLLMRKSLPEICDMYGKGEFEGESQLATKRILEQVEKHGTLDEIMIAGHGHKMFMVSYDLKTGFSVDAFLKAYADAEQKAGRPLTKRLAFTGCDVFSSLDGYEIESLRNFAKNHQLDIVGSPSGTLANMGGRYIKITKQGDVLLDQELNTVTRLSAKAIADEKWLQHRLGKSTKLADQLWAKEWLGALHSAVSKFSHSPGKNYENDFSALRTVSSLYSDADIRHRVFPALSKSRRIGGLLVGVDGEVEGVGGVIATNDLHLTKTQLQFVRQKLSAENIMEHSSYERYVILNKGFLQGMMQDDGKHVLLANSKGQYQMVDVSGIADSKPASPAARRAPQKGH